MRLHSEMVYSHLYTGSHRGCKKVCKANGRFYRSIYLRKRAKTAISFGLDFCLESHYWWRFLADFAKGNSWF